MRAPWTDRSNPAQPSRRIYTSTPTTRPGNVAVLSYRDYFSKYRQHPESKAVDSVDGKRCHPWTSGQLESCQITATKQIRVGKESNRLTDTHQSTDDEDDQVIEYAAPSRTCRGCDATVTGRRQWCSEACRKRSARESTATGA